MKGITVKTVIRVCIVISVCLCSSLVTADVVDETLDVTGIVGMEPVTANSCVAVWVPVPEGSALAAIKWYNNDGQTPFPEILLESGDPGEPIALTDCMQVGVNVSGVSSGWSELTFELPVSSSRAGLYVLFRFPADVLQTGIGAGGGPGIGYILGGGSEGWMSIDGENWVAVSSNCGFAFEPVLVEANSATPILKNLSGPDTEEMPVFKTAMLPVTPNPFNPMANISFTLKDSDRVTIDIFDIRGRKVVGLVDEVYAPGPHSVAWQSRDNRGQRVSSGVYFARLQVGSQGFIRRMVLMK